MAITIEGIDAAAGRVGQGVAGSCLACRQAEDVRKVLTHSKAKGYPSMYVSRFLRENGVVVSADTIRRHWQGGHV